MFAAAKRLDRPSPGRSFRRYQRAAAAALAGLAAMLLIGIFRPAPASVGRFVATTKVLPPGHLISDTDLTTVPWPASLPAPAAFTDAADAVGRTTTGALAAGELVGQSRVVGPGLLELANLAQRPGGASGLVASPVRLADAGQAALVRPGDTVDVLAARAVDGGGQSATLVAADATVLTVPGGESDSGDGLLGADPGPGSLTGNSLVVIAVDPETATGLAAAATRSQLSLVVKPAPARGGLPAGTTGPSRPANP